MFTTTADVQWTFLRCFAVLRQLHTIRQQIPTAVFQSVIVTLVLPWLDYCNSIMIALPANFITWLQSVHITSALISLHLLCISFKLAVMTIDQSTALHLDTYSRVSPVLLTWFLDERLPLIVKKCSLYSANGRSQLPAPTCGTTFRTHHICSLQTASQDYCTSIPIGTSWSSLIFLFFWHFPWTLQ